MPLLRAGTPTAADYDLWAGVTVMSRLGAAKALQAGTPTAADYPVPERQSIMLRHKQRYRTAAEREFIRLVQRDV